MQIFTPIRLQRGVWLSALLAIAMHGAAVASTETSPQKPATTARAKTTTAKHHASSHATGKASTAHKTGTTRGKKGSRGSKTSRKRGQQAIDPTRARQIQEALIREHYLQGEPSGTWDGASQAAMQRYQADQGWQSKTTPDSRALIKLGLGPSKDHLLNPESAMTSSDTKLSTKPAATPDSPPNQRP